MTDEEIRLKAKAYLEVESNLDFKAEVEGLLEKEDMAELGDRFWRELDFGTGGLRGVIGGGANRINTYTICRATQGLANYIMSYVPKEERGVVISFDCRNYSDVFAKQAACVFAANGIKAWLFTSLRPTPVLSFAVRRLGACAGIMITASHNPAKYNGYKVFWSDGAQVVPPHDKGIIAEVRKVNGLVAAMDMKKAEEEGLVISIDREIDDAYREMVVAQSLNPDMMRRSGKRVSIVYTPLHGAGTLPVESVLRELGMNVMTVSKQREPDGNFPTVDFPNPEIASALEMALKLAEEKKADLVMATDPDADRLGIAVPDGEKWCLLSGNRLGALLTDYIFRIQKERGTMPANPAFVNTIVTSELQNVIAEYYGAKSFRVLTGFKYIGEKIRQFEADSLYTYVFGGEESYGYLVGSAVRDKDAVSAVAMTAEMVLWNLERGKTLMQHLEELWGRFGYYDEELYSRDFEGQEGQQIMNGLMESLRMNPLKTIAATAVVEMRDFAHGTTWNADKDETLKNITLPSSNVLQFILSDGCMVTVRPSGTEPKIKFYTSCHSAEGHNLSAARDELRKKSQAIEEWINSLIATANKL